MVVPLLLMVIVLLVLALSLLLQGDKRFSVFEFYSRGKELGFSLGECRLIRETLTLAGIKDPVAVFWSIRDLDQCIRAFTKRFKAEGKDKDRVTIAFMEKLYDYRKKLEFDLPRHKTGIMSSRSIRPNQRVKVLVQGVGVFGSTVVDSNDRYLVVSMPVGARLPPGFQWKGARVSIYFWRQEDAGYVFDAYVLEDLRIRNIPVLQIGHSESLLRTQKRKSLRMRSRVPSYLYLLKRLEGAYEKPERVPGMKCVVQDLSEDGAAVLIGGKA
ncbi:MAG TPA: flagellar brake domain-containing protein, partial [Spirochaetales bacterium]|nr:flagellar brake domain-containing protein [Spirochaetales bacterium]